MLLTGRSDRPSGARLCPHHVRKERPFAAPGQLRERLRPGKCNQRGRQAAKRGQCLLDKPLRKHRGRTRPRLGRAAFRAAKHYLESPHHIDVDQEVGGSNPPSCTRKINNLEAKPRR
jgi:hypothetical protein